MVSVGPQSCMKNLFVFLVIIIFVCRHCNILAPSETVFRRVRIVATVVS